MTNNSHQTARAHLIDAVLDILMNEGPDGVGAIAVAKKLGLAPAAPYAYFNDRAGMVDAALEKMTQTFLETLHEAERNTETPLEALEAFTTNSSGLIPYITAIPRLLVEGAEDARWLEFVRRREAQAHEEITRLLAEAQHAGQVRTDIPAQKLARYYLGIGLQMYSNWLRNGKEAITKHDAQQVWSLYEGVVAQRFQNSPLPSLITPEDGLLFVPSAKHAEVFQEES